jgi:hypothetical protein
MHPIRKMLKYILWGILFFIVGLITIGLFVYRLDVVGYVQYLNTRDLMDVSLSQPMSFVRLFVPSQKEEIVSIEDMLGTWEDDTDTSGAFLDQDFMDFFGDFSKQDRASEVMTGADF